MTDERTEAMQAVVDRVTSYQDGAREGTVVAELTQGFEEAGVEVSQSETQALADAIEGRHGSVSVEEIL